jgi:hypothetical protein
MRRRALSDETAGRTVKGWEREVGRANAGLGGNQAFSFIGTAAFSAAGQVRYSQVGDETIIQANTKVRAAPSRQPHSLDKWLYPLISGEDVKRGRFD